MKFQILILLSMGSLALNRPTGPIIKYQLYDMDGKPLEGQFVEEDVELKRRKAGADFRNFLNGTPVVKLPNIPDPVSEKIFSYLLGSVRSLATSAINSEFGKVRTNPRDAAAIGKLVAKYYDSDTSEITKVFAEMDKALADDQETLLTTQAMLNYLDEALNGDFMDLSLGIMRSINETSPKVAKVTLNDIKKLQAKYRLIKPLTFDRFFVRFGKY